MKKFLIICICYFFSNSSFSSCNEKEFFLTSKWSENSSIGNMGSSNYFEKVKRMKIVICNNSTNVLYLNNNPFEIIEQDLSSEVKTFIIKQPMSSGNQKVSVNDSKKEVRIDYLDFKTMISRYALFEINSSSGNIELIKEDVSKSSYLEYMQDYEASIIERNNEIKTLKNLQKDYIKYKDYFKSYSLWPINQLLYNFLDDPDEIIVNDYLEYLKYERIYLDYVPEIGESYIKIINDSTYPNIYFITSNQDYILEELSLITKSVEGNLIFNSSGDFYAIEKKYLSHLIEHFISDDITFDISEFKDFGNANLIELKKLINRGFLCQSFSINYELNEGGYIETAWYYKNEVYRYFSMILASLHNNYKKDNIKSFIDFFYEYEHQENYYK